MGTAHRVFTGKPEGRRSLGRPKHSTKDSIKMDLQESEMEGVDWISVAWERDLWQSFVETLKKHQLPKR
jgi:hypothetical protein